MGVNIGSLVEAKEIGLKDLSGKVIGIDGYNVSYQFLARIRNRETGEPLMNKRNEVTSHLSGIFYRTSNLVEAGIKPLFVWDGKPPKFKKRTVNARRVIRETAKKKWAEALKRGEEVMVYAQASSKLTLDMVQESTQLLDYMGIPSIQAPGEGEAQLAVMAEKGDIWASASQDWDALLFSSPRLVRNLSITGRRKLPRKYVYVEIKPEIVELDKVLKSLGITKEQLIVIGMLVGTDYNLGVEGVGPKTALRLVKEYKTLNGVLTKIKWTSEVDLGEIFKFFLDPPITKFYEIKWKKPNVDKVVELLVNKHDFSRKRVEKVANLLRENLMSKGKSLDDFLV